MSYIASLQYIERFVSNLKVCMSEMVYNQQSVEKKKDPTLKTLEEIQASCKQTKT